MNLPATRAVLRIARRDARRNLARSTLIAALIGLPVLGVAAGLVVVRTQELTEDERVAASMGQADVIVDVQHTDGAQQIRRRLPDDAHVVEVTTSWAQGVSKGELAHATVLAVPLDDPLLVGFVTLLDGHAPDEATEAAVSPSVLALMGADVGDEIEFAQPGVAFTVTGTVVRPTSTHDDVVVVTRDALARDAWWSNGYFEGSTQLFVSTRHADRVVAGLGGGKFGYGRTRADVADDTQPPTQSISFTYIAGGLALFEAVLVAAAAFAVGARRQLRSLGLIGAAGGERRHLRRVVLGSGLVLGTTGAVVGAAVGIAVAVAVVPVIGRLSGRLHTDVHLPLLELVAVVLLGIAGGTAAAWLPARAAARVPTLAALATRRPLRRVRGSTVAAGVAVAALGVGLAAFGARPPAKAGVILLGAVVVVSGFTMCSPAIVALVGRAATRAPTLVRIGLRDAARHRARTGPAVAAIMAALSLPVAVATYAASIDAGERARHVPNLRTDQVLVSTFDAWHEADASTTTAALDAVRAALPGAVDAPLAVAIDARHPNESGASAAWVEGGTTIDARGQTIGVGSPLAVGDEDLLTALGGEEAVAAFRDGEVIALGSGITDGGSVQVTIPGVQRRGWRLHAVEVDAPAVNVLPRFVISDAAAAQLGLGPRTDGWLLRAPEPLSADERAAVRDALAVDARVRVEMEQPFYSEAALIALVALGICGLVALAVVAVTTALNLSEAKDDLATLTAVGASPRTRRSLTAIQAGCLAALGGLLALPAGGIPVAAVLVARRANGYPLEVPWIAVLVVAFVIPLLAAASGGLLTRSRVTPRVRLG